MLNPGTIFPPVAIYWQGQAVRTSALRGQPALLLFPCAAGCPSCHAFFRSLQASRELAYWSIRPLLVLPNEALESSTQASLDAFLDAAIIDTEGRCHALAAPEGERPALAVFDAYQEFRGAFAFSPHEFPGSAELESRIHSALRADPG